MWGNLLINITEKSRRYTWLDPDTRKMFSRSMSCSISWLCFLLFCLYFFKKLPNSWWLVLISLANSVGRESPFLISSNKNPEPEFIGPTWESWPALSNSLEPKGWNLLIGQASGTCPTLELRYIDNGCQKLVIAPIWIPVIEWVMSICQRNIVLRLKRVEVDAGETKSSRGPKI